MKDRHDRYRVHLKVRYAQATEFLVEYAENLSLGGLFLRGAADLEPTSEVNVELELPGFGTFEVSARVVHIVDEAMAKKLSRSAGAGMQITKSPAGFEDSLRKYLLRLGKRRDVVVMVDEAPCRKLLDDAGYRTCSLPEPNRVSAIAKHLKFPLAGIVLVRTKLGPYQEAFKMAGIEDRIYPIDFLEEIDIVLSDIDDSLRLIVG